MQDGGGAAARLTRQARMAGRRVVRMGAWATAGSRGLPDFLIIGTKRGGTTSLYRLIEQHHNYMPLFPSSRRLPMRENMKGVHFFDSNFHLGERWYRSHFPTTWAKDRREHAIPAITGDASPYYLFHPLAARRAAATVPAARLVVMLRDPVERTISHWSEQRRNGIETLALSDALEAEAARIGNEAVDLERGRIRRSVAHEHQSYAAQSHYPDSLGRWLNHFPREQLLVLFSEDFYQDPAGTYATVQEFLGQTKHKVADRSVRNASPRGEVDARVRMALAERFAPDIDRLTEIVGRRPPWPWIERSNSTIKVG